MENHAGSTNQQPGLLMRLPSFSCLLLLLVLSRGFLNAQETAQDPTAGLFPEVSLNKKIGKRFSVNAKLQSYFDLSPGAGLDYRGFESQNFVGYQIRTLTNLALGYQLNVFEGRSLGHRSILQLSHVQRGRLLTLGHRVRSDQTFSSESAPRFRIRYRLGSEIPLQGQSLDPGEFFVFSAIEMLGATQGVDRSAENRLTTMMGWNTLSKNKLQLGADLRTTLSEGALTSFIWLRLAFVARI